MTVEINPKVFVAELVGTFALVFIGAGIAAMKGDALAVALGFGLTWAAFIYAYGDISGMHLNPAVTFGMALSGAISWVEAVVYWIAQFLGGILATALLYFLVGGAKSGLGSTVLAHGVTPVQGLIVEAVLTFFLVTAVLHLVLSKSGGDFAGLVIGLTLTFGVLMGFPLTGGSLNPARSFGPAIFTGTVDQFWVYLIGPLVGAAVAAGLFKFLGASENTK
jgi:MIP family channel proteins